MANFTFKTSNSIGHIQGLSEEEIEEIVQANQDDDIIIDDDPENALYPPEVEEEAKRHDKHADDIDEFDDALYPVEVSAQLKMKDAEVLKRDYAPDKNVEEGMFPLTVTD